MSDTFAYWRNALCGSFGPVHENDPQPGYYRTRPGRDGRMLPVAIWKEADGTVRAIRDGVDVDSSMVWTWCCRNPVAYETYVAVAEKGEPWPEDVPVVGVAEAVSSTVVSAAVASPDGLALPGPGHNSLGAAVDPALELKATIDGLWLQASDWLGAIGTVSSQLEADRCANFAERFSSLEKSAEEERTREKKPVLEQGRAIDAKWKPVIGAADDAKRAMKKALEPYLLAETRRLQEAGGFGETADSVKAGTNGRRVSLRRTRRVSVSDRNAFIAHYRRDARVWDDEAVQKVVLRLAEADLAAGRRVPGAELVEEQVAA
ncbi:hypothetical protein [Alsobacter sp. R-9]